MAYPAFLKRWAERVYQQSVPAPRPEVEVAGSGLFDYWRPRSYNPDDLLARKGYTIYDKMRLDDQVKAALTFKKASAISTGWEIVEAPEGSKEDEQARDFVDYALTNMEALYGSFDDHLFEIMVALDYGYSCTEIVYRMYDHGPFTGKIGLRTLKSKRPFRFDFDVDEYDNLNPKGLLYDSRSQKLDQNKFLIFVYRKEFGNWYGKSDLRESYRHWWMKDNIVRWWGIYLERFGSPIARGRYPPGTRGPDITELRSVLENLQAQTAITYPNVYEIDFHEASGRGGDAFQKAEEAMNLAIARSVLVPNLLGVSPQGDIGSYSQARKQFDVFMLVMDDLRRDLAEDVMNSQLLPRLVLPNYNVEEPPRFRWLPFSSAEEAALFDRWLAAVNASVVGHTPEDEVHIRSVTGFPERTVEEIEEKLAIARGKSESDRVFMWHASLGIVTVNEIRQYLGYEPLPGGDVIAAEYLASIGVGLPPSLTGGGELGLDTGPGIGGAVEFARKANVLRYLTNPQIPKKLSGGRREEEARRQEWSVSQVPSYAVRSPNQYELHFDFALIERTMDSGLDETVGRARDVIARMREALVGTVARKINAGELNQAFVRNLDLKHRRDLTSVFRESLSGLYHQGSVASNPRRPRFLQRPFPGLPPEKALRFFEDKALWISGVIKDRLIQCAQTILLNHIKTGQTTSQTILDLGKCFEPYLGDPTALEPGADEQAQPYRLETIIRTNATEAFVEGMKDGVDEEVASGFVIGFLYSAIIDGRQTEVCEHLDGMIFRPDSDNLEQLTPPNHFNCRSTLIPVTRDQAPVTYITPSEVGRAMELKGEGF